MKRECVNCPGATDHDTAHCPTVRVPRELLERASLLLQDSLEPPQGCSDFDDWTKQGNKLAAELRALLSEQPQASAISTKSVSAAVTLGKPCNFVEIPEGYALDGNALPYVIRFVKRPEQAGAAQSAPAGEREAWMPTPDEIHQMAFEEGQPAENGDGYLFCAEEFDCFVQRLLDSLAAWQRTQSAGVPDFAGIGRDAGHPRAVVLYLRAEPTDDDLRAIQEALRFAAAPAQPAAQEAPTPETVWVRLLDVMRSDNGCHFYASTADFAEARDAIAGLVRSGFFIEWRNDLEDDYWMAAAGEQSEASARFASEAYETLSAVLNRVFERTEEPAEPAAHDQGEVQRLPGRWVPFSERWPELNAALDNPAVKSMPRVLVTNNFESRDRMGRMSHVWYGAPMKSNDGQIITFTESDSRIYGLTHWFEIDLLAASTGQEV